MCIYPVYMYMYVSNGVGCDIHVHVPRAHEPMQMLLEVNSHISELSASVNNKQDVLEIVPIQLLLGGELCGSHNGLIISASVISQY